MPKALEHGGALVGHRQVGGARRRDHDPLRPRRRGTPHDGGAVVLAVRVGGEGGGGLLVGRAGEQHGRRAAVEQLADDGGGVLRRLARSVHRLGQPLAEGAVVVDAREAEVGEREAAQLRPPRRPGAGRPTAPPRAMPRGLLRPRQ